MANQLDELNPEVREEGLDTNVIVKKIPAEVGAGSKFFEIALWILGVIPGLVFLFMKINAQKHFDQLQQKIQRNASQIDNYLEQRVMVLQNCAKLLDKAIDLDKETFENQSVHPFQVTLFRFVYQLSSRHPHRTSETYGNGIFPRRVGQYRRIWIQVCGTAPSIHQY